MHYADRSTVCVSSQAGCAMGCSFCATGQAGFDRHLTAGEIVEQVVRAAPPGARRRPPAVQRGVHGHGRAAGQLRPHVGGGRAAARRPRARRPATSRCRPSASCPASAGWPTEALPVNLAVSLHAADDELRDELVPINRRYPLSTLMDACAGYLQAKGRRLSFEWALIDGVNDRDRRRRAARRAVAEPPAAGPREPDPAQPHAGLRGARLARRAGARVPRPSSRAGGVNATVRRTRGTDIDAACGQLARHRRRRCAAVADRSAHEHGDAAARADAARQRLAGVRRGRRSTPRSGRACPRPPRPAPPRSRRRWPAGWPRGTRCGVPQSTNGPSWRTTSSRPAACGGRATTPRTGPTGSGSSAGDVRPRHQRAGDGAVGPQLVAAGDQQPDPLAVPAVDEAAPASPGTRRRRSRRARPDRRSTAGGARARPAVPRGCVGLDRAVHVVGQVERRGCGGRGAG